MKDIADKEIKYAKMKLDELDISKTIIRSSPKGEIFKDNEFPYRVFFNAEKRSDADRIAQTLSNSRISCGVFRVPSNSIFDYVLDIVVSL